MGIRIYGKLANGIYWSDSLSNIVKNFVIGLTFFVLLGIAHDNWDAMQDLWYITKFVVGTYLVWKGLQIFCRFFRWLAYRKISRDGLRNH